MLFPSTELNVLVTDANGTAKTFDSNASDPADRPRGIQFGTQRGSGFYTGSFDLRRAIDRDNEDVHKLDDVKILGADGDTAYEGYVGGLPRSMDDAGHTLGVTLAGWMGHTADQPFTMPFVDRDLGAWTPMSRTRRSGLLTSTINPNDPSTAVDPTSGLAALLLEIREPTATRQVSEALYDAGEATVARIYAEFDRVNVSAVGWDVKLYVGVNAETYSSGSANFGGAGGIGATTYVPSGGPARFAHLFVDNNSVGADNLVHSVMWRQIAVYGDHGLPLIGDTAPFGLAASDVMRYLVGLYAPLLNTACVRNTTYPIAHLVFKEDTTVYDALLRLNAFHLWDLAVWEKRTLFFEPIDLTDWDWEIRHDEAGNKIGLQGDSIEDLRNGIKVQFTNVDTGMVEVLKPADHPELRDDSIDNPANQHGRRMYGKPFVVPWPTTSEDALQLGRIKLGLDNQPKAPGSFTLSNYVRDRAGNWQPAWKVRAGDRVRLTSSANISDRPRLVHETSYDHDSRTVTVAVDDTQQTIEALFDRQQTALQAAGVS